MDTLYDNLDNYNEAKLIEELRNENQDLKVKIEKYTETLEKLQKDFDNLAAEYKKLELNYSSLLKTARAEIERKTQIITNLNIEKDMMVLNAIQNGNVSNVRRNWAMAKLNTNSKGNEEGAPNKHAANQQKSQSSITARKESPSTPTEDIDNSVSAENTNKNIKNENSSEAKENIHVVQKDKPCKPTKPASIRDRRKSMPAARFSVAKFSSDEEGEITRNVIEPRKDHLSMETDSWKNSDKNTTKDQLDSRSRNYDSDKYRSRDRFETQRHRFSPERFLHRSRKDYSGDRRFTRNRSRDHRQYKDGSGGYKSDKDGERFYRDGPGDNRHYRDRSGDRRPHRDNMGDHRLHKDGSGENRSRREDNLENYRPSRDGSGENRLRREDNLGDYRHRDGSGERRPRREDNLGNYRPNRDGSGENRFRREEPDHKKPEARKRRLESPTGDKYQQYQQKNHEEFERDYNDERNRFLEDAGNPKYHSDYEVPSNKRMRTDSYHRSDHNSKYIQGKALEKASHSSIHSEDMSCQSPDYLSTDLASVPKEIKLDAEVKIDDPREHSNKYTICTEDGEKVLTTVAGRNVDLKPVNKSKWKLVNVEIPVALMKRPSDDRINDIYGDMDIDDAASDISSAESGETMGSMYDISTDPFYRYKDVSRNDKIKDQVCHKKDIRYSESNMAQNEEGNDNSKNIEKVKKIENNKPEVDTISTVEQDLMQTELAQYTETIDKGVIPAEKITDYPQIDENITNQPSSQLVDPQNYEHDSIQIKCAVPSNTNKETFPLEQNITETIETKKPKSIKSNLSKYKIPKLRNRDQSSNSEIKLSENKDTKDKLNVGGKHLSDSKRKDAIFEVGEKQLSDNKRTEGKVEVGKRKKRTENIVEDRERLSDKKHTEVSVRKLSDVKSTENTVENRERHLSDKNHTEDRLEECERKLSDSKHIDDNVEVGERQQKHTEERLRVRERKLSDNKRTEDTAEVSERQLSDKRHTEERLEVCERKLSDNKCIDDTVDNHERQISDKKHEDRFEVHERILSDSKHIENTLETCERLSEIQGKLSDKRTEGTVEVSETHLPDKRHTDDRLEIRERKLSHNKRSDNKVEVGEKEQSVNKRSRDIDKHDSVRHKHTNNYTATVKSNKYMTGDKGMVEGDLELSDESSDIDLLKRVMKNLEKQSPRQSNKLATKNVLDKDDEKGNADCIIGKSISNNFTDVDLKLKVGDKVNSESIDTSKKGKSKNKTSKEKSDKESSKIQLENVVLSTHSKLQETEMAKDMKSKFSDLFGDSSSLITPEDLGLTAQDVRIESSSTNYFPIFEDAQDAADLGGKVGQTKSDLMVIVKKPQVKPVINIVQNKGIGTDKNEKSKEKKTHDDKLTDINIIKHKPRHSKSLEKEQQDHKPKDANTKTKSCKSTENEHSKKVPVNDNTKTSKHLEKQQVKKTDADETKTKSKPNKNSNKEKHDVNPLETTDKANELKSRMKHSKNETDEITTKDTNIKNSEKSKSKHSKRETDEAITQDTCNKYLETERSDKPLEENETESKPSIEIGKIEANDTKPKSIETRKRKYKRQEDKSQLTDDTEETPQPAVITIVSDKTSAELAFDKSHASPKEPEIVKTVIISSGIQPLAVQENMQVNVISPILEQPVTPNIDSRTQTENPILGSTARIQALATSTPAKEILQNVDVTCRTPDVSNTSNEQNSINNNEMDAPDVRIFVKRKRRVIKKVTPTKT